VDPLSQGVLGASLPQASTKPRHAVSAGILGFLAGMTPDLDVLIRSATDPLLFLEYHRQFTHSLIFIPLGGLLCALVLHIAIGRRRGLRFRHTLLFCTLGYATHGLLDACTTYGTLLFWPFSDQRVAWNTISIIDPLFTLPLLFGTVFAALKRQPRYAQVALVWALSYMAMGLWQRDEAQTMGNALAQQRGHTPIRLEAKPSFANILVWKIVYEAEGDFYVDAVRTGFNRQVYPGESIAKLNVDRDFSWLQASTQQAKDIERFRWFSNDYLARDPADENRIIDIRYSMLPNEVVALWSIELNPQASADAHVSYHVHRDRDTAAVKQLWSMLLGRAVLQ